MLFCIIDLNAGNRDLIFRGVFKSILYYENKIIKQKIAKENIE